MEGEDGRKEENDTEQVINLVNIDENQEVMDKTNAETNAEGHLDNLAQSTSKTDVDQNKPSVLKTLETEQTHRDDNLDFSTMTETAEAQNALSDDLSKTDMNVNKLPGSSDAENNKGSIMATGKHENTTKEYQSQTENKLSALDKNEQHECETCQNDEPRTQEHQPKSSKGTKGKSVWLVQKCKKVWHKIRKPKQKNQHETSKNKKCSTAPEDELSPGDWSDEEGEVDNEHCSNAEQTDCAGPIVESKQTECTVEMKEEPSKREEHSADLYQSARQSDVYTGNDIVQVDTLLLQSSSSNVKSIRLKKSTFKVKENVEPKMLESVNNLSKHRMKQLAKQRHRGPNRHQASTQQTRNGRSQIQSPPTSYKHSGDEEEEEEEMEVCEGEKEDDVEDWVSDKERNEETERKQKGAAKTSATEIMETQTAVQKHRPNRGKGADNTNSRIPVYQRKDKSGASVVVGEHSEQKSSNGSCAKVDTDTQKPNQQQQKTQVCSFYSLKCLLISKLMYFFNLSYSSL